MPLNLFVDGTTFVDAAVLDQLLGVGTGGKHGATLMYARVRYTGTIWQVNPTTDSAGLLSPALTWNTDHLDVTVTTFAAAPACFVSRVRGTSIYHPSAVAVSNTLVGIEWRDNAGVLQTVQSVNMDCHLIVIGA